MHNFYQKVFVLMLCLFFCFNIVTQEQPLSTSTSHAVKTQYYRWYQMYERDINELRVANQLEILDSDIVIETIAGTMKGRDTYPERVKAYKKWKNAHHVQNVTISKKDQLLFLEADIIYQAILPNETKKNFALHYTAQLKNVDGLLPIFTQIKIVPKTDKIEREFKDAYPDNRIKSLIHYWLLCMEQLDGNVNPFKELLTDNFELNFSTNSQITSITQLEKWLNGMPMQLQSSQHFPKNLSIKQLNKNKYQVNVEFEWLGVMKNGPMLKATTAHEWIVLDDINQRFAKIQKATVRQIKPLQQYNNKEKDKK
ncbi:hypothetical protein [Candidatus Uabimicrobium sp. HlEnr_7]|uniref:hypothetical protein n=1 Tax=Candidatus Uabimicrobium helgolandensis TaxID=3095367 RepID=UPI003557094C